MDCDMIIFAIGVTPNTELVEDTKIETRRGIFVDKHMQTNFPDIYAAGDVVEIHDLIAGETRPIAIWPNASKQGEIAGANMAGGSEEYEGSFAMNSIEICDVPTISVGLTDPDEDHEIIEYYDEENFVYKKLVLDGGRLVGAIFINDVDRAGIYTGIVKNKLDISDLRDCLLEDDFGLIKLPDYYREKLLSGAGMKI